MLILTRRPGEALHIGQGVSVQVLDVKGNQVRIGIAAPEDIQIVREELLRRPERKPAARPRRRPSLGVTAER